jgi:hypothetical protein
MNAKDVIRSQMGMGLTVLKTYVSDLSDADLLLRPAKGCNHLAWQIGHLIAAESQLLAGVCPGASSALPAGFAERHSKQTTGVDDPASFQTKQQYLDLFDQQRAATLAALDKLPEADLERPAPEHLRKMFQFVVVRRQLGKPVLI